MSVSTLGYRILFKSFLVSVVIALFASTASGAVNSDSSALGDASHISNQGYLVHPDELRELGFSEWDIARQSQKFNSMSTVEKMNWNHLSAGQKIDESSMSSLAGHDISALNQCYSAQYAIGRIQYFCSFGTQVTDLDQIRYVSPGQHAGRVMYYQYGDGTLHWTLWRKGTGQWFQMPYVTYYKIVQWPVVVRVQRAPHGAVAYGSLR